MVETMYTIQGCPAFIAFLADTHDIDPEPVLASLRAHAPALIVHTGDHVHGKHARPGVTMAHSQNAMKLLRGCARLAPTFLSIGNHETYLSEADFELIRSTGVVLLDNTFTALDTGAGRLVIGGLSSGYYTDYRRYRAAAPGGGAKAYRPRKSPEPDVKWLDGFAAAAGYHVLLMHHPEYIRLIPSSIELVLSGHAHGGQWRFYDTSKKQWRGVYAPDQGLLPQLTGGIVDDRQIISRGLGNPARIPRFHNEPEIVYISGC